jgi:hypothetical protein
MQSRERAIVSYLKSDTMYRPNQLMEYLSDIVETSLKENTIIEPFSLFGGSFSIKWLYESVVMNKQLDISNRAYQREFVASLGFQQGIMQTICLDGYKRVPEVHIRVRWKKGKDGKFIFIFEMVDGQQRTGSILNFLNGDFVLPESLPAIDGHDIRNLSVNELRTDHSLIFERIMSHNLKCTWYFGMSDEQTSDLFINVLNNVSTMRHQEIRNATEGALASYIRNYARPLKGEKTHDLFERTILNPNSKKPKIVLNWFSKEKFTLNGHMELDQWISEMIYFSEHDYSKGLSESSHSSWIQEKHAAGGDYKLKYTKEAKMKAFWDFSLNLLKAVKKAGFQEKMAPMVSQILILFANELVKNGYKIENYDNYVTSWFNVYNEYSKPTVHVKVKSVGADGKPKKEKKTGKLTGETIPPFSKLFGGKGATAIANIRSILNKEFKKNFQNWGVIKLDPRETFDSDDTYKRWVEVGKVDEYEDVPIEFEDVVGDHDIPRSWGIDAGGVTEYHNLRVCSKLNNLKKGNKSGEQFREQLRKVA